jgi:O-acetyl-ADP-ribose deacetylase (regulator of RNase III)
MADQQRSQWRFGYELAELLLVQGRPLDFPRPGLYVPGNGRGIMAAGLAGEVRLRGGQEIERELRGHTGLLEGEAYLTGPGRLATLGIQRIAHGIVTREPGGTPRSGTPQRALSAGLRLLAEAGVRAVTAQGVGTRVVEISHEEAGAEMARVIAAQVRQSRLREIVVTSIHPGFLAACRAELVRLGGVILD